MFHCSDTFFLFQKRPSSEEEFTLLPLPDRVSTDDEATNQIVPEMKKRPQKNLDLFLQQRRGDSGSQRLREPVSTSFFGASSPPQTLSTSANKKRTSEECLKALQECAKESGSNALENFKKLKVEIDRSSGDLQQERKVPDLLTQTPRGSTCESHTQDNDQGVDLSYDQRQVFSSTEAVSGLGHFRDLIENALRSSQCGDSDSASDSGCESPDLAPFAPLDFTLGRVKCDPSPCLLPKGKHSDDFESGEEVYSKNFSVSQTKVKSEDTQEVLGDTSPDVVQSNGRHPPPVLKQESGNTSFGLSSWDFRSIQKEARRAVWSDSQKKVIRSVVKQLDLKDFASSSCLGDANFLSQILIMMLIAKRLQTFLVIFAHSVTCSQAHSGLCAMFKRFVNHVKTSNSRPHHCALRKVYAHILRLHLDACSTDSCGFPNCKLLRANRRNKIHNRTPAAETSQDTDRV